MIAYGTGHFGRGFFEFLSDLKANNDREWFNTNKQRYVDEVEAPMLRFIADFGERMKTIQEIWHLAVPLNQYTPSKEAKMTSSTKQIVEQYYDAWRTGDVNKFLLAENFTFDGPIQSASSPDEFRGMAAQFAPMVKGIKVLDALHDNDKAFVMAEFATNVPQLGSWIAFDYFVVEGKRIKYSRTMYDPRRLVDFMQAQSR